MQIKITPKVFAEIKRAFEKGEVRSVTLGCKFWGVSSATMYKVLNSKDYAEYISLGQANMLKPVVTFDKPTKRTIKKVVRRGPYKIHKFAAPVLPKPVVPTDTHPESLVLLKNATGSLVSLSNGFFNLEKGLKDLQAKEDLRVIMDWLVIGVTVVTMFLVIKGL